MADIRDDLEASMSDPDPVRRAQIQMLKPLPKRFYTEVTIGPGERGGHAVLLDGRSVKTPLRNALTVPTQPLARILAAEWDAQADVINPVKMPVTRIVNTAIDGITADPRAVFNDIVNFAGTDLLCYRAESPEGLIALQDRLWNPVLDWAAKSLRARFVLAAGIVHRQQPTVAIEAFADALRSYATPLGLASLHTITTLTGSALLALAFAEQALTAEAAWTAAHADEDWQAQQWGQDEDAIHRRKTRWIEMQAACAVMDALRT